VNQKALMWSEFHFLRPLWLLAIVPAVLLAWLLWRQSDSRRAWKGVIADHLLPHLLVGEERHARVQPLPLMLLGWVLTVLALAGPAWAREPAPFAEDTAALVIVVKVTPSMMTEDIPPNRLARSTQKVTDLLKLRPGAQTGLIAYAGSAHRVMPLTRDAEIIDSFTGELSPGIMPIQGDVSAEALKVANDMIERSKQPGWILLVCDGIAPDQRAALAEYRKAGHAPVSILAVAGEGPELQSIRAAASELDSAVVRVSADDRDVRRLAGNTRFSSSTSAGGESWRDEGYWLVPPIVTIMLFWFRPGWMVRSSARG